jgi:hypothetical protein
MSPTGKLLSASAQFAFGFCRDGSSLEGCFSFGNGCQAIETGRGHLTIFSKCPLKSLNNQADFDSAIRKFDPSRPSHAQDLEFITKMACSEPASFAHLEIAIPPSMKRAKRTLCVSLASRAHDVHGERRDLAQHLQKLGSDR